MAVHMTRPPTVAIRRLGPADVATMHALNACFAAAFEDDAHYLARQPDAGWLEQHLAQPHVIALVAEADGAVIGGLVAYVLAKLEQARSEIYIYDLAVAEPWRRQGIATALIDQLRRIARELGAWAVYVQADHGDPPAIALYSKLGTREDVLHFDIAP
jgi:aminoglycoside 3-N-acetyltransferase I